MTYRVACTRLKTNVHKDGKDIRHRGKKKNEREGKNKCDGGDSRASDDKRGIRSELLCYEINNAVFFHGKWQILPLLILQILPNSSGYADLKNMEHFNRTVIKEIRDHCLLVVKETEDINMI